MGDGGGWLWEEKPERLQRRGGFASGPRGEDAHQAVKRGKKHFQQRGSLNCKEAWRAVACRLIRWGEVWCEKAREVSWSRRKKGPHGPCQAVWTEGARDTGRCDFVHSPGRSMGLQHQHHQKLVRNTVLRPCPAPAESGATGWHPATCILLSPLGDCAARWGLRSTHRKQNN